MKGIHLKTVCRLVWCLSASLLASCTLTHTPPPMLYAGSRPAEKVHLKVALNLTDELRNTKWDIYGFGETDVWPVGQPLAANIPLFARQTFMDVVEINNSNLVPASVDAVLTPKVPLVGFKPRSTTFSSDTINLKLEWTLAALNGDVIWADTATGESRTSSNWWRTFRLAMEQALGRSRRAMLSSPAIQQFVLKKYPGVQTTLVTNRIADPAIMDLCDSLTSTDRGGVKDALKELREIRAAEAVPDILPCLKHQQPDVVREACRTLAALGDKNAIPAIELLLNNPREDIRKDAQQAIDKLNPDVAGLCRSLNSTNPGELKNALKKLREIRAAEVVPNVLPCLKDPHPDVVRETCRTLAVLGNKNTVPDIQPLLNNPREDIRKDAQQAITKLNPDIMGLRSSLTTTNRGELKDVLRKLREMHAPEVVPDVVPCLKNPDPGVVREACRTLAVLGNKDTVHDIEPLLDNPRDDIRKDAQIAVDILRSKSQ